MKTLTVTIDGRTFKRRTPRAYTHVVVGRRDYAADRARTLAAWASDASWAEQLRLAALTAPMHADIAAASQKVVDAGRDAYVAAGMARFDARTTPADACYSLHVLGWSQSAANAEKMAAKYRGQGGLLEVQVRPLEQ